MIARILQKVSATLAELPFRVSRHHAGCLIGPEARSICFAEDYSIHGMVVDRPELSIRVPELLFHALPGGEIHVGYDSPASRATQRGDYHIEPPLEDGEELLHQRCAGDNVLEALAAVDFLTEAFHQIQIAKRFHASNDLTGYIPEQSRADADGELAAIGMEDGNRLVHDWLQGLHGSDSRGSPSSQPVLPETHIFGNIPHLSDETSL
jgi:hypothetical protein